MGLQELRFRGSYQWTILLMVKSCMTYRYCTTMIPWVLIHLVMQELDHKQ